MPAAAPEAVVEPSDEPAGRVLGSGAAIGLAGAASTPGWAGTAAAARWVVVPPVGVPAAVVWLGGGVTTTETVFAGACGVGCAAAGGGGGDAVAVTVGALAGAGGALTDGGG